MNWLKYKKFYFWFSAILIAVSIYGYFTWGLKLGVDFTGGTLLEYRIEGEFSREAASVAIEDLGFEVSSIQETSSGTYLFRLAPIGQKDKEKIKEILGGDAQSVEELRFEAVGPSIGPELVKKTIYAISIAAGAILVWIAFQFKSIKFGASAILAMFHDTAILIGSFTILGHFYGAEIDFLFVTALLTTLSFSVHDTIVVFDRVREIQNNQKGSFVNIANRALSETMIRSLNNSFTITFMLVALILLGGITVKWFAVALLIGTVLGTYSSPFVAVPLLVVWDKLPRKK